MSYDFKLVAAEVDRALDRYLPGEDAYPQPIHRAMRYSVFAGGKRLRPLLTLASAAIFDVPTEEAMPAACAIELVHTYSLIHDDLPALDDDDYRRGRPSNHKVFGEALAILAGDALLTMAFGLLAREAVRFFLPEVVVQLAAELASAAGTSGMIGGQVMDILTTGGQASAGVLEYIHTHKTGALFACCLRSGAIMGGAGAEELAALTRFAQSIGLAFQIVDDILDITGDEALLGKKTGADQKMNKATYPALFGLREAEKRATEHFQAALAELVPFGERAGNLAYLARQMVRREK